MGNCTFLFNHFCTFLEYHLYSSNEVDKAGDEKSAADREASLDEPNDELEDMPEVNYLSDALDETAIWFEVDVNREGPIKITKDSSIKFVYEFDGDRVTRYEQFHDYEDLDKYTYYDLSDIVDMTDEEVLEGFKTNEKKAESDDPDYVRHVDNQAYKMTLFSDDTGNNTEHMKIGAEEESGDRDRLRVLVKEPVEGIVFDDYYEGFADSYSGDVRSEKNVFVRRIPQEDAGLMFDEPQTDKDIIEVE